MKLDVVKSYYTITVYFPFVAVYYMVIHPKSDKDGSL